jgi:hypothetical protein
MNVMPITELPTISSSAYGSVGDLLDQAAQKRHEAQQDLRRIEQQQKLFGMQNAGMNIGQQAALGMQAAAAKPNFPQKAAPTMRIVKVIIADTDESLPLDRRVIYTGPEHVTDLTDQELFYEIPIATLLAAHNKLRVETFDTSATVKLQRDVLLKPIRIRDLKMVVVTVASF